MTESEPKKIVLPGDELSSVEELLPGEGTFEDEAGIIRASRLGTYQVDSKNRKALVNALTSTPVEVQQGDIVLGEVVSTRSSMIIVNVFHVEGKKRSVTGDTNGTIRVSEIANGYVKDANSEFGIGDIIRARVTQVKPSIQLTTKDRHHGSIKSLCTKCRHAMARKDNILECPHCNYRQKRKITDDYGNIDPTKL